MTTSTPASSISNPSSGTFISTLWLLSSTYPIVTRRSSSSIVLSLPTFVTNLQTVGITEKEIIELVGIVNRWNKQYPGLYHRGNGGSGNGNLDDGLVGHWLINWLAKIYSSSRLHRLCRGVLWILYLSRHLLLFGFEVEVYYGFSWCLCGRFWLLMPMWYSLLKRRNEWILMSGWMPRISLVCKVHRLLRRRWVLIIAW